MPSHPLLTKRGLMLLQDNSTIEHTGDGRFLQKMALVMDEGPELEQIHRLRMANALRQHGFSDNRTMKFNAQIPAWRVWEAENILGFNLADKKDFRKYLILHPEFIIAPVDTGRSGKIIVKGH
jgi:hypothetical protein